MNKTVKRDWERHTHKHIETFIEKGNLENKNKLIILNWMEYLAVSIKRDERQREIERESQRRKTQWKSY